MNLNSSLQSMLDTPTKAFEVALRCFVADNLLCQYPDEQSLKDEIQKRIDAIKGTQTPSQILCKPLRRCKIEI